jgi:hypothetical protein
MTMIFGMILRRVFPDHVRVDPDAVAGVDDD